MTADVALLGATPDDRAVVEAMLALAAHPSGTSAPADPLADDHVARYVEGWGRRSDLGLVARVGGDPVGAAWTRLLGPDRPGYGFVDAATPELAVAVAPGHRGRGLGRALVAGALDLAAVHGHERVSLSVADAANPGAAALYRSLGFVEVGRDDGGSLTMLAPSRPGAPPVRGRPGPARPAGALDGPALARLRQVMFSALGVVDERGWVAPLLAMWPEERASGAWVAHVADDGRGRPVASAMALVHRSPPGPGRPGGLVAHVGSVATEAAWRRRGAARTVVAALLAHLDRSGVESSTLNGSPEGIGLYRSLGFTTNGNVAMRRPRPTS